MATYYEKDGRPDNMSRADWSKKVKATEPDKRSRQLWTLRYAVCLMQHEGTEHRGFVIGNVIAIEPDYEDAYELARLYVNNPMHTPSVDFAIITIRTRLHTCPDVASDDIRLIDLLDETI
jgi:hypothetical protein